MLSESGCRDPGVDGGSVPIDGYRIECTIVDGLDQPMEGIDILLYYDTIYVSNTPVPNRAFVVPSPGQFVTINVYDAEGALVRNLYGDVPSSTQLYVPWDKRTNDGTLVGSGLYTVRYLIGSEIRHSYEITLHGLVTAETDSNGTFMIDNRNLPLNHSPAPFYDDSDSFAGYYEILDWVYLEFVVANALFSIPVRVKEDAVTYVPTVRID